MANNENLTPFNESKREESVTAGKKGGIASGKARRERKEYAEQLKIVIELGTERALELAKEANNDKVIKMIEEGGLLAFEHLNILMDQSNKPEVRLKALDMMIDRLEGKPIQSVVTTGSTIKETIVVTKEELEAEEKAMSEEFSDKNVK